MEKIVIPPGAAWILQTLQEQGYEAFIVGGCVRDACLGRTPSDWDITTSATPQEVISLFPHTVLTGAKHGTVTVLIRGEAFEVTTYRIDGAYTDGRHPDQVTFSGNLADDLCRRDFTINAMAYNEKSGLIDLYGGKEDLARGLIRCVGDPRMRLTEDGLRILRAVRFGAQLGFSLEAETERSVRELASSLARISAERIHAELEKILVSPRPGDVRKLWQLGITRVIFPEFDRIMEQPQTGPHHELSVGKHTLLAMEKISPDPVLRFTMLFHDLGKCDTAAIREDGTYAFPGHAWRSVQIARELMRRWRFDNESVRRISCLVAHHSDKPRGEEAVRRCMHDIGRDLFPAFLQVRRADVLARKEEAIAGGLEMLDAIEEDYRRICRRGDCVSLRELAVGGADLIRDGMEKGPQIGRVLEALLEEVLSRPENNRKEILLERSRELRRARE